PAARMVEERAFLGDRPFLLARRHPSPAYAECAHDGGRFLVVAPTEFGQASPRPRGHLDASFLLNPITSSFRPASVFSPSSYAPTLRRLWPASILPHPMICPARLSRGTLAGAAVAARQAAVARQRCSEIMGSWHTTSISPRAYASSWRGTPGC